MENFHIKEIKEAYDEYRKMPSQNIIDKILGMLRANNYFFVLLIDRFEILIVLDKENFGIPIIRTLRLCISSQTPSNFIAVVGMRVSFLYFESEFFIPIEKYKNDSALLAPIQANQVMLKVINKSELESSLNVYFRFIKKNHFNEIAKIVNSLTGRHVVLLNIFIIVLKERKITDSSTFLKQTHDIKTDFMEKAEVIYSLLLKSTFPKNLEFLSLEAILKNGLDNIGHNLRKELCKIGLLIEQINDTKKIWQINPSFLQNTRENEN